MGKPFDTPDELKGMVFHVEEFWRQYRAVQPPSIWNGKYKQPVLQIVEHIEAAIQTLFENGDAFMTATQTAHYEPYARNESPSFDYMKPDHYARIEDFLKILASAEREALTGGDGIKKDMKKAGLESHFDVIVCALEHCRDYAPSLENGKLIPIERFQLDSRPPLVDPKTGKRRNKTEKTQTPKKFDT